MSEEAAKDYLEMLDSLEHFLTPIYKFTLEHKRSSVFRDLDTVYMLNEMMREAGYGDEEIEQANVRMMTEGYEPLPNGDVEWQELMDSAYDIALALGIEPDRES
jgi:hypothetical protein